MAKTGAIVLELTSASDYSAKRLYLTSIDTAGKAALPTVAGVGTIGVVQNAPAAAASAKIRVAGRSEVILGGTVAIGDKLTSDSSGRAVTAHGADRVIGIALEAGTVGLTGDMYICDVGSFAEHAPFSCTGHINLADIADAGLVYQHTPGFIGRVKSISMVPSKAASTSSKLSTLTGRIATTAMTGGVLAATTAALNTAGVPLDATAISALNLFTAAESVNIIASATTTFIEGEADIRVRFG